MKFFIFIFALSYSVSTTHGLMCNSSVTPATAIDCSKNNFCLVIDMMSNNKEVTFQGCGDQMKTGTTTVGSGFTGQFDCCNDKDLCNNKSLDKNAKPENKNGAIKPFAFGFLSIFVILASLFLSQTL
uniref:UPAR/Ly6 domain-containing protein n=1 Tax=Panagrolaimus sp. ES5 TaxID=591445 RepID=A0AC34FN92_9BILA